MDNPAEIMIWVGEKYDEECNPEKWKDPTWTLDTLTTVCIYYSTNSIMTSVLPYTSKKLRSHNLRHLLWRKRVRLLYQWGTPRSCGIGELHAREPWRRTGNLVLYNRKWAVVL